MIIINNSILNKDEIIERTNRFKKLIHKETVTSTNDYALNYVKSNKEEVIVISDEQTDGRGKGKRKFLSPKNRGIYMSIGIKSDINSSRLLFAITSVAIVKTLEYYNITAEIKWPNDININKKKISGILIESFCAPNEPELFSVVGVGINLYNDENTFKNLSGIVSSIEKECEKHIDKTEFIIRLLTCFENLLLTDKKEVVSEYKKYLVNNEYQTVEFKGENIVCKIKSITEEGIAYVQTKDNKFLNLY